MPIPLSASDVITVLDNKAKELAALYPALGLGLAGEVGTGAAIAGNSNKAIQGDGSTQYGLSNAELKAALVNGGNTTVQRLRWDTLFQQIGGYAVKALDAQVLASVPAGWTLSGAGSLHLLNNWLLRINAAHAGVPATPAAAGTLTATTSSAGAMPVTSAGNAPRIVHTLGGTNEWDESQPSPEATQVALTGTQNGYSYQIAGVVPAGVTWVKTYRGYLAGTAGIYYYDQKVTVTPGSAYPPILLTQSDSALLTLWTPPAWLSCLLRPEAAAIIALSYAPTGQTGIPAGQPLPVTAANMANPANVLLGPANGFLGIGNNTTPQGAQFGTHVVGSAFVPGAIGTANNAPTGLQGFAGALGLRARVTSPLDVAGTLTASYSYYDASHGFGNVQTATSAAVAFSGTAVGSLAVPVIPAGRLVISMSGDGAAGQSSGAWLWEAAPIRP
jgi:hypothetical protein